MLRLIVPIVSFSTGLTPGPVVSMVWPGGTSGLYGIYMLAGAKSAEAQPVAKEYDSQVMSSPELTGIINE